MSKENVQVVRRFNEPYDGRDLIPVILESVERLGPDPQPEAVLADWAGDPTWQHAHPEIEWDVTAAGAVGGVARGPRELALWWRDWVRAWQSYTYRVSTYRDLGDWVLTRTDVKATGPGGIPVEMRICQIWQVRDGKVAAVRHFFTEQEALEAVELRE